LAISSSVAGSLDQEGSPRPLGCHDVTVAAGPNETLADELRGLSAADHGHDKPEAIE